MKYSQSRLRHNARRFALQALYQWHYTSDPSEVLIQQFSVDNPLPQTDVDYFNMLLTGTIQHVTEIDAILQPHLDRAITALSPVELSVLRLAVFELSHSPEVPFKVVINEALELTKEFGTVDGYKYVNAVLDAVRRKG